MDWHCPTWLMYVSLFHLSLTDGSCGWQTVQHSLCRVQGLRSVGETAMSVPLNCGLQLWQPRHLQKELKIISSVASACEDSVWLVLYKNVHIHFHWRNMMMFQLDFTGERVKVLQSNAESNHTEAELLRDKNTKFIASIARHQETISKLQEVTPLFLVCYWLWNLFSNH